MLSRRKFINKTLLAGAGACWVPRAYCGHAGHEAVMTVNGPVHPGDLQFTLSHEHIMVDFIGAEKVSRDRYNTEEVFNTALPILQDVKKKGCLTFIDCTPAYLGRDVQLLHRLSKATGLHIITNTGCYGAAREKYLPGIFIRKPRNRSLRAGSSNHPESTARKSGLALLRQALTKLR